MSSNSKTSVAVIGTVILAAMIFVSGIVITGAGAESNATTYSGQPLSYDQVGTVLTFEGLGSSLSFEGDRDWDVYDNETVTYINIKYGVVEIGADAFKDFTYITHVTIPSSVHKIGANAFSGCTSLAHIYIYSDMAYSGGQYVPGFIEDGALGAKSFDTKTATTIHWNRDYLTNYPVTNFPKGDETALTYDETFGTGVSQYQSINEHIFFYLDTITLTAHFFGEGSLAGYKSTTYSTRLLGSSETLIIHEGITDITTRSFRNEVIQEVIMGNTCYGSNDETTYAAQTTEQFLECTSLVKIVAKTDAILTGFGRCPNISQVVFYDEDTFSVSFKGTYSFMENGLLKVVKDGKTQISMVTVTSSKAVYISGTTVIPTYDVTGTNDRRYVSAFGTDLQGADVWDSTYYFDSYAVTPTDKTSTKYCVWLPNATSLPVSTSRTWYNVYLGSELTQDRVRSVSYLYIPNMVTGDSLSHLVPSTTSLICMDGIGIGSYREMEVLPNFYYLDGDSTHAKVTKASMTVGNTYHFNTYLAAKSGDLSTSVHYLLYDIDGDGSNYTLMIYGSGAIPSMDDSNNGPWLTVAAKDKIKVVAIMGGITSVGDHVFEDYMGLTTVAMTNSLATIGESSFEGCTSLESVLLPYNMSVGKRAFAESGLTEIAVCQGTVGEESFKDCESLTSVFLLAGVSSVGKDAFASCSSLNSIKWFKETEGSTSMIGEGCFATGRTTTMSVTETNYNQGSWFTKATAQGTTLRLGLLEGTNAVGNDAYYQMEGTKLVIFGSGPTYNYTASTRPEYGSPTSVVVESGITVIGKNLFNGLSSVTSVDIPGTVTTLKDRSNYGCTSLATLVWTDSVTTIGSECFKGCTSLISADLPSGLTSLGTGAFENTRVADVVIPSTLTEANMGTDAFKGDTGLRTLEIPLNYTDKDVFSGCTGIQKVILRSGTMPTYTYAVDGETGEVSGTATYTPWYQSRANSSITVSLPSGITSISQHMFRDCAALKTIAVPDTIETVGQYAFSGCIGLKDVALGSAVESLDEGAFSGCTAMTGIVLPASLTTLGADSFEGCCSLREIYTLVPEAFTSLGTGCFDTGTETHPTKSDKPVIYVLTSTGYSAGDVSGGSTGISATVLGTYSDLTVDVMELTHYGQCGNSLFWKYEDHVLKFIGSGSSWDFDYDETVSSESDYIPWRTHIQDVYEIVMGDGMSGLGDDIFHGMTNLYLISRGTAEISALGSGVLYGCQSLGYIAVSSSAISEADSFDGWYGYVYVNGTSSSLDPSPTVKVLIQNGYDLVENGGTAVIPRVMWETSADVWATSLTSGGVYHAEDAETVKESVESDDNVYSARTTSTMSFGTS